MTIQSCAPQSTFFYPSLDHPCLLSFNLPFFHSWVFIFSSFQFIFFELLPIPVPFPSVQFWLLSFGNRACFLIIPNCQQRVIASKAQTNALHSVIMRSTSSAHKCAEQARQDEFCAEALSLICSLFCGHGRSGQLRELWPLQPDSGKALDFSLLQILQACMSCNAQRLTEWIFQRSAVSDTKTMFF